VRVSQANAFILSIILEVKLAQKQQPNRFARILVHKDGKLAWYGPMMAVRHEGLPKHGEISQREYERRRREAVQLYGQTNVERPVIADSSMSWAEAEQYFESMAHETITVSWAS
jgi:hypothetical protein